jgi:hypothetical protein
LLFLADHANSSAAARGSGFHYIHVLVITHFSLVAPALVVLREKISCWANLEIFSVSSPLSLNVTPKVAFVTNVPGTGEVINLLKLIHIPKLTRTNETCPEAVPRTTISKPETGKFERIDNTIIGMSRIVDSKGESGIRFQIVLSELLNSVLSERPLYFQERRIIEKDRGLTAWNWSISTSNDVVRRSSQKGFFQ